MTAAEVQVCDQRSVGLLVVRDGSLLLGAPSAYPAGYAPIHRHCDGLPFREAATALCERAGLTAALRGADEGWRPDVCPRPQPATAERTGHQWLVYWATDPEGEPDGERLAWWTRPQLQDLADHTVAYARGALGDNAWRAAPGVDAVWVGWLAHLRLISPVSTRDLRACADVAARPIGGWR